MTAVPRGADEDRDPLSRLAMTASGVDARPIDLGQPLRLILGAGGPPFALVSFLLAGPIAEELGWRGFVQPRLRRFLAPVATSVVLGVGWAIWHLPLFLVDGTTQSKYGLLSLQGGLYLAGFVPLSYLAWFVSERLGGGVVAAILLHLAGNATQALLRNDPMITTAASTAASTAVATVLAVLVHVAFRPAARPLPLTAPGRRWRARRHAADVAEKEGSGALRAGDPAVEPAGPRG